MSLIHRRTPVSVEPTIPVAAARDWLTSRAAAYRADAEHIDKPGRSIIPGVTPEFTAAQRRAIAHELDELAAHLGIAE